MNIKIKDDIEDTLDDFKVTADGEVIPLGSTTMKLKKDQILSVGPDKDITVTRAKRLLKRKFATEVKSA